MLYTGAVDAVAAMSLKKVTAMKHSLTGFITLAALGGFYISFGVLLAFVVAAPIGAINPGFGKIAAGMVFGIALALCVIAGGELFTGYSLFGFKGTFRGTITFGEGLLTLLFTYIGNLFGCMIFALMLIPTGVFGKDPWLSFVLKVATYKMNAPWWALFFRGIFCNWLVCLGVWCSFRCTSDSGKLIMIWWTLFAFITTGMEHCVANMNILTLACLLPHDPAVINFGKMFGWNLVPVTIGNIIGGGFFVCFAYWFATFMDELGARRETVAKGGSGASELPKEGQSFEELKDAKLKMRV